MGGSARFSKSSPMRSSGGSENEMRGIFGADRLSDPGRRENAQSEWHESTFETEEDREMYCQMRVIGDMRVTCKQVHIHAVRVKLHKAGAGNEEGDARHPWC